MATHHNRKPVYQRESSPLDINVTDLASHVYQWKETGIKPSDVAPENAWMPPFENSGDIVIWSDANTLGYPAIPNAPMFWSDGGLGQAKILQIINHVANRKSSISFSDYSEAVTWVLNQTDVYTNLTASILEYILGPGGYQTLTIVNNTTRPLVRMHIKQTTASTDIFHAEGHAAAGSELAEWLPIQPGASIKLYGILATTAHNGPDIGTRTKIGIDAYWDQAETKTIDTRVNGITGIPSNVTSSSYGTTFSAARAGSTAGEVSLQNGDDVTVMFTSPGFTTTGPQTASASNYVRISSTSSITDWGQVHFSASNPTQGGLVQITRYDANGVDFASKLATVVANKPAGTGSDNQYISLGFNIEVDAATGSLTTGYNALGYNWGMSYSAFDTSTLSGPYANVPNPTLKTINGVEVYEFVGAYEAGYNTGGVTDATTPEPILITFRYE